eukprot:6486349-Amphidinium_carterae.1
MERMNGMSEWMNERMNESSSGMSSWYIVAWVAFARTAAYTRMVCAGEGTRWSVAQTCAIALMTAEVVMLTLSIQEK